MIQKVKKKICQQFSRACTVIKMRKQRAGRGDKTSGDDKLTQEFKKKKLLSRKEHSTSKQMFCLKFSRME